MQPPQRVVSYIDGYNLYYGLCDANFRRYLWLNVHELSTRLLLPHQHLLKTKYFTARVSGAKSTDRKDFAKKKNDKRKRQSTFLDALGTVDGIEIFEGNYLEKRTVCEKCGASWMSSEEKMTDVNIATQLLIDAFDDVFDTALLISGDSDLTPPAIQMRKRFGKKRLVVAFPPERHSAALEEVARGKFFIGRNTLKKSQFPPEVETANGYMLKRPPSWK